MPTAVLDQTNLTRYKYHKNVFTLTPSKYLNSIYVYPNVFSNGLSLSIIYYTVLKNVDVRHCLGTDGPSDGSLCGMISHTLHTALHSFLHSLRSIRNDLLQTIEECGCSLLLFRYRGSFRWFSWWNDFPHASQE
jgi:hypothetical protein